MFHSKNFDDMDSKKLSKRKTQPKRQKYIEDRPIAYILDDVKETIVTENTYKPVTLNVLKRYFLPKGWF